MTVEYATAAAQVAKLKSVSESAMAMAMAIRCVLVVKGEDMRLPGRTYTRWGMEQQVCMWHATRAMAINELKMR
ncbi:unnamed protein product [Ceratitis capitata]|uniref:(Mediterranean fruit fly) hypothetical protein n=1 Tax=Ceratitis capitata TaxID=7213 RepID=A0A811UYA9_CERCA|nr:unnamed protein product [Ceratitis capitata]